MNKKTTKVIAGAISLGMIVLLLLAGPAQGFGLKLTMDKGKVVKGGDIKFDVEVDPSEEVTSLYLDIKGPEIVSCNFYPNGTVISGCKGLNIQPDSAYGYGYGYGYGSKWHYTITLHTDDYKTGRYVTTLIARTAVDMYTKQGGELVIGTSDEEDDFHGGLRTVAKWECTEWSECSNGLQTRSCKSIPANAYATQMPETGRQCQQPINLDEQEQNQNEDKINLNSSNDNSSFSLSGITGAAVSGLGKGVSGMGAGGIAITVLIILIIGMLIAIAIARSRRKVSPMYL